MYYKAKINNEYGKFRSSDSEMNANKKIFFWIIVSDYVRILYCCGFYCDVFLGVLAKFIFFYLSIH